MTSDSSKIHPSAKQDTKKGLICTEGGRLYNGRGKVGGVSLRDYQKGDKMTLLKGLVKVRIA